MSRPESLPVKRWHVASATPLELQQELVHRNQIIVQVLYNRGIAGSQEIEAFLDRQYLKSTDPFKLPDMDKAVARIKQAIDDDEMVVVYGDFDADGVTATVLLVEALRGLGMSRRQAQPYIPDRVDEGYGLNSEALQSLKEKGAGLVITVDCGIRSVQEVEATNEIGLDIIITDHHSLGPRLPPALAIVNPKRPDSKYPETALAGVGIAFKVAQALRLSFSDRTSFEETSLLDLVALGTVADLVPLVGENRLLVARGLEVLNKCQRPGMEALAKVSSLKPGAISAESIAFGLAPRINAAGRLAHAYDAARLLAVNNSMMAKELAKNLNQLNRERQQLTKRLSQQAEEMVEPDAPILFAADPEFKSGVVGLVASRLADKHYRPAIVIEIGETESRGSCRSIPEFHITKALDQAEPLLERHGGHAQAAGFTIRNENLAAFQEQMVAIAQADLEGKDLIPSIPIDAELNISDVDWALQGLLEELEPTGNANPKPVFLSRDVHVYSHRAVGQDGAHLQLYVGDGQVKLPCIAFRQGSWAGYLPDRVDLAYSINVNEWNGRRELQLVVQDIRQSGELDSDL
jgi:single-stranded-DNA-specific exonuclease